MSAKKLLLFVLLGLIGLAVVTGIAAVLFPDGWVPEEILATIAVIGVYTLGSLVTVTAARAMPRLLVVCLVTAAAGCAGFISVIWLEGVISWRASDWMVRICGASVFVCLAMVHRMVLGPMRLRAGFGRVVLRTALISGPIVAGLIAMMMLWENWYDYDELIVRVLGVSAIVAAGSSVATGVVWFFERRPEHDEPGLIGEGVPVELACPRCGSMIRGRSNRECRCEGCRLKVRVEVEEPRCACGYLLYQLVGDVCPECGRAVAAEDRWAVPEGAGGALA
ncbi:MAG: hypothetical protein D6692_02565 [Planctomycetota bacterium]|nr:MAG: hypothetical protein D6692_02565 [Planctomycetota bacterium]